MHQSHFEFKFKLIQMLIIYLLLIGIIGQAVNQTTRDIQYMILKLFFLRENYFWFLSSFNIRYFSLYTAVKYYLCEWMLLQL